MQWHIIGAGAIGCLWAHNLTQVGFAVRLILRNEQRLIEYQATDGIRYTDMESKTRESAPEAELACNDSPITHLLVTTKAFSTKEAVSSVKHRLQKNAHIVLLQNGMGQHEEVSALLPHCKIWAAVSTDGVYLDTPFRVVRAGQGETVLGQFLQPNQENDLTPLLPKSIGDLTLTHSNNVALYLWRKLAINAAINPLTALLGCKNGELTASLEYRNKVINLCDEIEAVASHLKQPLFDQILSEQVFLIANLTANNFSSMHQDVLHQRKTEIDYINGYLQSKALSIDLDCPLNDQLINDIRARALA